jgi:hypothetical protein
MNLKGGSMSEALCFFFGIAFGVAGYALYMMDINRETRDELRELRKQIYELRGR